MLALYAIVLFAQVKGLQFSASVSPQSVYVGQQVSYDATIRANVLALTSFQAPPEYAPPDIKGATLYDFPFDTIRGMKDVDVNGLTFKQFLYHRAIFPLTPGTYIIPGASLVYMFPNAADPYAPKIDSLRSAPQTFTALPLPVDGQPRNFTGVVGQFTIAVHPDSQASFHVGTAFVLHVIVAGTGNIDLLPRPVLKLPWATVVPSTENIHWDSTETLVQGSKDFQWLVNPQTGGSLVIPALQYSYFDPTTRRYVTTATPPLSVTVSGQRSAGGLFADTIGNTPFPILVRTIRAHLVLVIVLVALMLIGVVALVVRAQDREPID